MKFPKLSELDAEQRAIYNGAPPTESILVVGPPGTGKTVMAFHRAAFLKALSSKKNDHSLVPRVIMFNSVLSTYASTRDGVAPDVETSTMHSWAGEWWQRMFHGKAPSHPDSRFNLDWTEILKRIAIQGQGLAGKSHWGHLIIDEGQDFSPKMYACLGMVSALHATSRPAITVFADENQRLQPESNSSIEEIQAALSLRPTNRFALKKNYRNSRQIAQFTRHFYVGLPSGIPDLPERVGRSKPRVLVTPDFEVARHRIATFASNNPGLDVGVICMRDAVRKKIFNSISERLRSSSIVVQTYTSYAKDAYPASALKFDKGGSVTVLNYHSSKGLEFDAVFIVDPFSEAGGAGDQQASMLIYVMGSRAREYLELVILNPPSNLAARLPPEDCYDKVQD